MDSLTWQTPMHNAVHRNLACKTMSAHMEDMFFLNKAFVKYFEAHYMTYHLVALVEVILFILVW